MNRYTVKAHSDHYTVRDDRAGDILVFEFSAYLDKGQAGRDARAVAEALNHAYASGRNSSVVEAAANTQAMDPAPRGYPTGDTSISARVMETWRETNS